MENGEGKKEVYQEPLLIKHEPLRDLTGGTPKYEEKYNDYPPV